MARHENGCTGEESCGGTFECEGCNKEVGWCFGAADDMPDHCDDCWAEAHKDDDK